MQLFIIMFSLLFSIRSSASFLEDFGASTQALGLGGQSNLLKTRAANNYYLPASLAHNTNILIEASSFLNLYNIEPISNIVVENSINTESGDEKIGSVANDFSNLIVNSLHLSLPIQKINGSINISVLGPFPYAAQFDSGDPYLPEYSLLKSRPRRPQGMFNFSYALTPSFGFSIGAHVAVKAESNIFTKAAVNNEGETTLYTYASANGEVTPRLAPILSFTLRKEDYQFGLSYQGELESSLKVDLTADEISTGIIFDSIIESIFYYDPQTLRSQGSFSINDRFSLHASINYYLWKEYQTPKINITQLAVMTGTYNYETLELRNTISPKLALTYGLLENLDLNFGLSYEQSPIKGDFSGNGNTIHSDSYTISFSPSSSFLLFGLDLDASFAVSHKIMKKQNVSKTSGQENGQPGRKIGAPGYKIGGNITTVSFGLGVKI